MRIFFNPDIKGPRKNRRLITAPAPAYQFLLVMDFEWTCDNKPFPHKPEIIEFPAVLIQGNFPFHVGPRNRPGPLMHDSASLVQSHGPKLQPQLVILAITCVHHYVKQ